MQIIFQCPRCQQTSRHDSSESAVRIECMHCDWTRTLKDDDIDDDRPTRCLTCGCEDLWRQKDFPPAAGLTLVGIGTLLSIIAWANYEPVWALGILMGFAAIDLVLYSVMQDMLVCYRCRARHRKASLHGEHAKFNLEVAERYRQQELSMKQKS